MDTLSAPNTVAPDSFYLQFLHSVTYIGNGVFSSFTHRCPSSRPEGEPKAGGDLHCLTPNTWIDTWRTVG